MGKRVDIAAIAPVIGTLYPPPFDQHCRIRERRKLGNAGGLTQFGVNLLRLPPDTWSSQRHWHTASDEFVYVLQGEVVLVTNNGEELLGAGDAAAFKAGDSDGHCLQNRSNHEVLVLEVGSRIAGDAAYYPDIDMVSPPDGKPAAYTHRDGSPYSDIRRAARKAREALRRCRNVFRQRGHPEHDATFTSARCCSMWAHRRGSGRPGTGDPHSYHRA